MKSEMFKRSAIGRTPGLAVSARFLCLRLLGLRKRMSEVQGWHQSVSEGRREERKQGRALTREGRAARAVGAAVLPHIARIHEADLYACGHNAAALWERTWHIDDLSEAAAAAPPPPSGDPPTPLSVILVTPAFPPPPRFD